VDDGLGGLSEQGDKPAPVKGMIAAMAALLLTGGIFLDVNRINSVRESLDRVAHLAAFEAAASPRSVERKVICQRRFAKTVWTDSEVSLDEIDVDVTTGSRGNTATVSYDATVQLVVGRFFGFNEVVISGEAEVTAPNKQVATVSP
jgi:uncharacterized membrane protein